MGNRPYAALVVGRNIADLAIAGIARALGAEGSLEGGWLELSAKCYSTPGLRTLRLVRPYFDSDIDEWYFGFVVERTGAWSGLEIDIEAISDNVEEKSAVFERIAGIKPKLILVPEYR